MKSMPNRTMIEAEAGGSFGQEGEPSKVSHAYGYTSTTVSEKGGMVFNGSTAVSKTAGVSSTLTAFAKYRWRGRAQGSSWGMDDAADGYEYGLKLMGPGASSHSDIPKSATPEKGTE